MAVVHVLSHLAAAVLVLSGIAKLRQPGALLQPLRQLRLPARPAFARAVGLAELSVGVAVLATSLPAVAAASAVVWAALLVAAVRLRGGADCGCFGAASQPVGPAHLVVNAIFTVAAAVTVADPAPSLGAVPDAGGVAIATYVLLLFAGAGAVSAILTAPAATSPTSRRRARTIGVTPRAEVGEPA